jgi:hypothetical protein
MSAKAEPMPMGKESNIQTQSKNAVMAHHALGLDRHTPGVGMRIPEIEAAERREQCRVFFHMRTFRFSYQRTFPFFVPIPFIPLAGQ